MAEVDSLDRRIAHALQIDGRVPFARLASVLGVSDQTVARRYARLRSSRSLRVIGLTDPSATGETQWYVRVRARPDAAQAVAEALARRSDTSWVMLLAGGTEMICTVRAGWNGNDLLLSTLPRTARVTDVRAHCRLHEYFGGRRGAIEKIGPLGAEQVEALLGGVSRAESLSTGSLPADPGLDDVDHRILAELARDGRARVEQVASATAVPEATVRRRLEVLRRSGVLFFDVELDNRVLGREVAAVLWLKVEPASLHAAGEALAGHSEITFAAACTGPHALFAHALSADPGALYRYLTTSLAALPGVTEVESAPVIRLVKGPA